MSTSTFTRTAAAGTAGGAVFFTISALLFTIAHPLLFDPDLQSAKLIAVWEDIEPLPLSATAPLMMALIFILVAIGRAFIYRWLANAWPPGVAARALRYALLVWFLSLLFFEMFTPWNLLGEPVVLVLVELAIWAVVVLAEGFVFAAILERKRR